MMMRTSCPCCSGKMGLRSAQGPKVACMRGSQCPRMARKSVQVNAKEVGIDAVIADNRKWAKEMVAKDPEYFVKHATGQAPPYLWIGCSDSRVPPNSIMSCDPGEVFVHRNVGNQVLHSDMNVMSAIEFSVGTLGVTHIIVCGHYNCGAIKGSLLFPSKAQGVTNLWIQGLRECRNGHADLLRDLPFEEQYDRLVELNVVKQVFNTCTSYPVQQAWEAGKKLEVHGVIYELATGHLKQIVKPITGFADMQAAGDSVDAASLVDACGTLASPDAGTVKIKAQKRTKQLAFLRLLASALNDDETEEEKVLQEVASIPNSALAADEVVFAYMKNRLREDLAWSQPKVSAVKK